MERIPVGILGATGEVGQKFVVNLQNHPWFEIRELYASERSAGLTYGGAVGYFSFAGDADTAITIRTLVAKNGVGYVQAGAGIVADSVPEREYEECMNKARALLKALQIAESDFI